MSNVKVRVLSAVVDGNGEGSEITISEAEAKHLAKIGYVEILAEESKATKSESAPKAETKQPAGKSAPKTKDK